MEDLADGHAAADLGITGTADPATATAITGSDVVYLGVGLSLASLNDGRGVRVNSTPASRKALFSFSLSEKTTM